MELLLLKSLVEDTLFDRQRTASGCFSVNQAGLELIKQGEDVLPVIESVLSASVGSQSSNETKLVTAGLDEVIGAYLIIGAKHSSPRPIEFIRMLSTELQAKALAVAGWYFGMQNGVRRFSVAPPTCLLEYVKMSLGSPDLEIRESAEFAHSRISQPPRL